MAGAGWATLLSQLFSGGLCLYYISRKFPILHLKRDMAASEKGVEDPMYQMAMTLLESTAVNQDALGNAAYNLLHSIGKHLASLH